MEFDEAFQTVCDKDRMILRQEMLKFKFDAGLQFNDYTKEMAKNILNMLKVLLAKEVDGAKLHYLNAAVRDLIYIGICIGKQLK